MELLTSAEAAAYLRIKERKLYELVAHGGIPCTKATGRWLFPRGDLDRWLLAAMSRPPGVTPAEPPPIVGGSHDPLLQWALLASGAGLALLPEGSASGYRRFLTGGVTAAAIHFHDLDDPARDANVAMVASEPLLLDAVLIGFAVREQGVLTAPGNPLGLVDLPTIAASGARIAVRPDGAGAQQLLAALLMRHDLALADLNAVTVAPTGHDIAQAVGAGVADCGIATRSVATPAGLAFKPLIEERFDLLVRQRDSYRPPFQRLLALMRGREFAARAAALGGLDVTSAGTVRWAP